MERKSQTCFFVFGGRRKSWKLDILDQTTALVFTCWRLRKLYCFSFSRWDGKHSLRVHHMDINPLFALILDYLCLLLHQLHLLYCIVSYCTQTLISCLFTVQTHGTKCSGFRKPFTLQQSFWLEIVELTWTYPVKLNKGLKYIMFAALLKFRITCI